MIKEIISNTFTVNINKQNEIPPITQIKEVISNTFNLNINKEEVIPPEQIDSLDEALKDYTAKLEHIRECIQAANERIANNVFDLKTYEDIFNKLTDNGKKKAIIMENGELYINATYVKSGLLEGLKIKTSKSNTGQYAYMEESCYSAYEDNVLRAFFGFKTFGGADDGYRVPKFYMGAYGLDPTKHNYFGMTSYRGNGDNPESNTYAYQDLSYRCINSNFNDYSNIKMYSSGDVALTPVKNLVIKTNFEKGEYKGTEEKTLATFTTFNDEKFNSNLEIGAIRNTQNTWGLILGDDHHSDWNKWARVQLQCDSSGGKYFRPHDAGYATIELGSASFPWKKVTTTSSYASEGVMINEVVGANIRSNDIIDNIEFITPLSENDNEILQMDVTKIQNTNYVEVSEEGQAFINETAMIKLLLKEVKQLKEEIQVLKGGA